MYHPGSHLNPRPFLNPRHGRHAHSPLAGPSPCTQATPGTKMSPKPRREKGRSHRARGEVFSLGTFSTMGSCEESRV